MGRTKLLAAALAAFIPAASANEIFPHAFADPNQFNAFYNRVINELARQGVQVQQTCYSTGAKYCANWMSMGNPQEGYASAFNIHQADGVDLQEVCYGGLQKRRCAFSNGFIYDQEMQNGTWTTVRVIADGFGE